MWVLVHAVNQGRHIDLDIITAGPHCGIRAQATAIYMLRQLQHTVETDKRTRQCVAVDLDPIACMCVRT